jgi:hypothetical protein
MTMASQIEIAETQWFRFLSRWGLVGGLIYLSGFVLYAILAPSTQASSLPEDLALGTAQPTLYRFGMTNDMLDWLVLAGLFLGLAGVFARRAPIRSALLAACAGGQFIGFVGAAMRFKGNTDLAAQYVTAAPDQQAVLLRSFLDLQYVINACFFAGSWLWTVALALVAWLAWERADFPRWLVGVVTLNAIISVPAKTYEILTGESAPFVVTLVRLVLLMVICFCVAAAFWRRAPALVVEVQPTPAH